MKELLALPWQIQVVIVGGYFAYVIAYAGKRSAHKSVDTLAIILCFGGVALLAFRSIDGLLPAKLVKLQIDLAPFRWFVVAGGAIFASLASAVVWRRFLGERVQNILRKASKSEDDGLYYGWETLIQHPNLDYNQLNVSLKDGRVYESYPLSMFDKYPNGPCVLGGDGSIAMYVTHIEGPDKGRREVNNLTCETEGARITYIPADQIAEVDFRRKTLPSKSLS